MTPDVKSSGRNHENGVDAGQLSPDQGNKSDLLDDEEDFFDFISRYVKKPDNSYHRNVYLQIPIQAYG